MKKQLWVEPKLEELSVDQTLSGTPWPYGEGVFVPDPNDQVPVPLS